MGQIPDAGYWMQDQNRATACSLDPESLHPGSSISSAESFKSEGFHMTNTPFEPVIVAFCCNF